MRSVTDARAVYVSPDLRRVDSSDGKELARASDVLHGSGSLERQHPHGQVDVELISDLQRLEQIESQWRTLWSRVDEATPFQSPDWGLPWWRHYGEGHLLTYTFWGGDQLVGIAPLCIFSSESDPTRRLFLIGTGNTDYLDVLFLRQFRERCRNALLAEISRCREQWDECNLQRLRPASTLLQEIDSDCGLIINSSEQEPCVAIDFTPRNPAEAMLKTANVYARKLRGKESCRIEDANPDSLDELLSAFEQLHERRWQAKGFSGVLTEQRDRSFHHEVASRFLRAGMLMLYALRVEGRIVSVVYGFHHRDRTYSYLSGFDPEYRRQSVGTILVGHAIQQSIEDGRSFDFLKGQEPYKYRWGAHDEPVFGSTIRKAR